MPFRGPTVALQFCISSFPDIRIELISSVDDLSFGVRPGHLYNLEEQMIEAERVMKCI